MSREELVKEAEDYANKKVPKAEMPNMWNRFFKSYLAGADPREKQIQIDAEQILALQKQNGELTDKVNKLEAHIEKTKCCGNCYYFNISKNIGTGNLFCNLKEIKNEFCKNKDHWKLRR